MEKERKYASYHVCQTRSAVLGVRSYAAVSSKATLQRSVRMRFGKELQHFRRESIKTSLLLVLVCLQYHEYFEHDPGAHFQWLTGIPTTMRWP